MSKLPPILFALLTIGLLVAALPFVIRGIIFQPPTIALEETTLPKGAKLIRVTTEDNLNLAGLWVEPQQSKPIILLFHGNAYSATAAAHWFKPMTDAGYGLVAAEYRGYSGNPGKPSQTGVAKDADAFLTYAKQVAVDRPVIVIGHSLGGGVALDLALRHRLDRVITIGTFTGIKPLAPSFVRWLVRDPFDNENAVKRADNPLMIIHGTGDEVIPFSHSKILFAAAAKAGRMGGAIALPGEGHEPDATKILLALEIAEAGRDEKADPKISFTPFNAAEQRPSLP
jgi:uncharacterized protein